MEKLRPASLIPTEHVLHQYGVDVTSWGHGEAKTLRHLRDEVTRGESVLQDNNGELQRVVRALGINVYCQVDGELQQLRQTHQEFKDGRVRPSRLSTSLGEKLLPHEDELAGVRRALQEELGIEEVDSIASRGSDITVGDSPSYPGLKTELHLMGYEVFITPDQYQPAGYIEEQPDKKTFFRWETAVQAEDLPALLYNEQHTSRSSSPRGDI